MSKSCWSKIRDKPIEGVPVIEVAEFADPADAVAEPASNEGSGAGSDLGSFSSDSSGGRERRLKDYQEQLEFERPWVSARIQKAECPGEVMKSFRFVSKLGFGGFGDVFKVEHLQNHQFYAMKIMSKRTLQAKNGRIECAIREKTLMNALEFEFIVKLAFAFKDERNLYIVTEFACCGDIFSITRSGLPEETLKCLMYQCVLGLEYLHANDILHRDIKAENLFMFEDGYIKIGDFGLAKVVPGRTYTSTGTTFYMAPEALAKLGYGKGVDWWAFGILLHYSVYNRHPFVNLGASKAELFQAIMMRPVTCPPTVYPNSAVYELLEGLLKKKPAQRLGMMERGTDEVKNHEWFKNIYFFDILRKNIPLEATPLDIIPEPVDTRKFLPEECEKDYRPDLFIGF